MADVRFINLRTFDATEVSKIKTIVNPYVEKLQRDIHNCAIAFYGKKYDKAGDRVKYSFHARLEGPSYLLSAQAFDWDVNIAAHKVMKKLESEMKRRFKTEGQKQGKIHVKERGRQQKRKRS
ncbi:hypothetical protein J4208_00470 [Candidatus Woesearchaeota archaeon]|nr:hypothetical protein [Candidatus Woesearchaeota archaeon]